jgi:hypothetical protein
MLDAYDIFFHRDPFEVLSFNNTIVLFEEGWPIRNAGVNPWWIDVCFGTDGDKIKDQQAICSGTIFGPPDVFIKFAEFVLEKWPKPNCLWDQPIINYLLYTAEFERIGVKITKFDCNGPVLTLSNCPQSVKEVNGIREGFNGKNEIPYVVHQWKQFPDFKEMYVDRCDMTDYIMKLAKINKIDLNWVTPIRS